jgi:hypothetical protein
MKKVFVSLLFALAFVTLALAAQSWSTNVNTYFPVSIYAQYEKSADSITGVDSVTLFKNVLIDNMATYVLRTTDSTGTADSMILQIQVYNAAGSQIYAAGVDTIVSTSCVRWSPLPINKTVAGTYMTVKARSIVATVKRRVRSCALYAIMPVQPYPKNMIRPK